MVSERLKFIKRLLNEADPFLMKGDPGQASEKLYKVVVECIKALAGLFNMPQLEEVKKRGRWDTWLLGMALTDLSRTPEEDRIRLRRKMHTISMYGVSMKPDIGRRMCNLQQENLGEQYNA